MYTHYSLCTLCFLLFLFLHFHCKYSHLNTITGFVFFFTNLSIIFMFFKVISSTAYVDVISLFFLRLIYIYIYNLIYHSCCHWFLVKFFFILYTYSYICLCLSGPALLLLSREGKSVFANFLLILHLALAFSRNEAMGGNVNCVFSFVHCKITVVNWVDYFK